MAESATFSGFFVISPLEERLIYQEMYDELIHASHQIVTHRQRIAKQTVENLVLEHVDVNTDNASLMAHLVSESLLKRIDRQLVESKNIYIQQFDIPQTELFYSMALAVPFVYEGHSLANSSIVQAIESCESATVLDIGVGRGQQMKRLIETISEGSPTVKRLTIIGLDPVLQNIDDSAAVVTALQESVDIELTFKPVCNVFEALSDEEYNVIQNHGNDCLAVTSAFSFHHTSHPLADDNLRTQLLTKIAHLNPAVVTLVEPNSNHDTEYLPLRVHNAWLHFGTVFALIDESDIEPSHKFLIKEKFFGREIRDIFGISDVFRVERHELYDNWLLRLFRAGFTPVHNGRREIRLPDYCGYTDADGVFRMDYNDTTVVAVLSFQPGR